MKHTLLILLFLISLQTPMTGSAQPRGRIVSIDNSVFVAMLDSSIEDCVSLQRKENWCWAACVQMAMRYCDVYVGQEEIAKKVLGGEYNLTASGNEIAAGLNGWYGLSVHSYHNKTSQSFIDEISKGHPLIVGIGEHAYLLTHIYYKKASNGGLTPFKAILINPKSGKEEVKDWNDFYSNLNTIVSIH